jgi:hypothetical protein
MEQNMNGTEKIKPELIDIRTVWHGHDFSISSMLVLNP